MNKHTECLAHFDTIPKISGSLSDREMPVCHAELVEVRQADVEEKIKCCVVINNHFCKNTFRVK